MVTLQDLAPLDEIERSLRRKLGDSAASPACIFNTRGVGYRMEKPTQR